MTSLNIRDPKAHSLARRLADQTRKPLTDSVILALEEALARRTHSEDPHETALRIFKQLGIDFLPAMREPADPAWRDEIGPHLIGEE